MRSENPSASIGRLCILALALVCLAAPRAWAITDADIMYWKLYEGTSTVALGPIDYDKKFSKELCDCNGAFRLEVSISPAAMPTSLSGSVQVWAGSNCGDMATLSTRDQRCKQLDSSRDIKTFTVAQTFNFFAKDFLIVSDGTQPVSCPALTGTPVLWILVDVNNDQVYDAKNGSIQINYDGELPPAPTNVLVAAGDGKVKVTWGSDPAQVKEGGFQILCASADNMPLSMFSSLTPAYSVACADPMPYPALNAGYLCSGRQPDTSSNVDVGGLTNGTQYQFAVVAFDKVGNPSALSPWLPATPTQTEDAYGAYRDAGGLAEGGVCSALPGSRSAGGGTGAILLAAALAILLSKKRRRG